MSFEISIDKDGEIEITNTDNCSLADVEGEDYIFNTKNQLYRIQAEEKTVLEIKQEQEVAREIFEEIEQKCLFEEIVGCSEAKLLDEEAYAELKKKRIGE